ncbi:MULTISPECIES: hypothetical protein [unclassified Moorena]|nr:MULTISPECIES: hypothetical protein [unclassified Moorena]NEO12714.1 hypothetical protein [Moorena sp. SIO3E8]NEO23501.1 hypothetical protein [Moorena sp. SIO4A5]NEO50908.1 hypothetical protein [Moorena sp. SIO4A3]NEP99490.1 hypothetical protein [Moorena sp. SIO3F7]
MTLIPCEVRFPISSYLFPVPRSAVPCSLKSRNSVRHSYENCYIST